MVFLILHETIVLGQDFNIDDMPNDVMRDIYQYWLDMRGDRLMPSRSDLKPEQIARLLPYIVLVDVEAGSRYKFRLVGTETVKAMGFDATGKHLEDFPRVEYYLKDRYDWIVEEKRPYFIFDKLKWTEKSYMDYYVLGFPLSGNGQDVDILMFALYYQFPVEPRTKFME